MLCQVICTKVRDGDKRIVRLKEGEAKGRHVVIVDDLVQSGSTLLECGKLLKAQVLPSAGIPAWWQYVDWPSGINESADAIQPSYFIGGDRIRVGEGGLKENPISGGVDGMTRSSDLRCVPSCGPNRSNWNKKARVPPLNGVVYGCRVQLL